MGAAPYVAVAALLIRPSHRSTSRTAPTPRQPAQNTPPTSRERRNRVAVIKLSAVTGPTPGICMKRRHSSWPATNLTTRSCSRQYSFHSALRAAIASRKAYAKPPRPVPLRRMPNAFRECRIAFSGRGICASNCAGASAAAGSRFQS